MQDEAEHHQEDGSHEPRVGEPVLANEMGMRYHEVREQKEDSAQADRERRSDRSDISDGLRYEFNTRNQKHHACRESHADRDNLRILANAVYRTLTEINV